jgi:peptidoglycan/xylan/chitin deacetylase (PgdA/CDA1 family)
MLARRLHKEIAARCSRKLATRTLSAPIISFTFDDFPRSALNVAGDMLLAEGVRGTYYAALGLMGSTTSVGPIFHHRDLDALLNAGHELACHTFHHVSSNKVSLTQLSQDCAKNRAAAGDKFGGCLLRNFSFPQGEVTLTAKRNLALQYESCRTIEPGINGSPADLAFLRANPVYTGSPLENLRALIAENSLRKGWLIFYTHDVSSVPSKFGCTPDKFRQVLSWATASGAEILTVARAVSRFQVMAQPS